MVTTVLIALSLAGLGTHTWETIVACFVVEVMVAAIVAAFRKESY